MPDRRLQRLRRLLAPLAALVLMAAVPSGALASAPKGGALTGWLSSAVAFPQRTLVLSPPAGSKLTTGDVRVTENGTAVGPLTVTPVGAAPQGQVGVMVVVDQSSSMSGAGLRAALAAVRTLAARRPAGQQLGVVTFAAHPTLYLPLTADTATINQKLAATPATASGSDPASAVSTALTSLQSAKVALGAVVVISDGVGVKPSKSAAYQADQAAVAAHTPVITLGLQDGAASKSSLLALRNDVPGQYATTTPSGVASLVSAVEQDLERDYLVSYRSSAASKTVDLSATATGIAGSVTASYQAPAAPTHPAATTHRSAPAHPAAPARHAAAVHHPSAAQLTTSTALSPTPSFDKTPAAAPAKTSAPAAPVAQATSFWQSPVAVPAVSALIGMLVAIAVAALLYSPSRRPVRTRIGSFIPTSDGLVDEVALVAKPKKKVGLAALQRGSWWPPFVQAVEIARLRHSPADLVKRSVAAAAVAAVLLWLITGSTLPGLGALLVWPYLLRKVVFRAANKQRFKFGDSLPSYLQDIASSIRVGRSFVGALTVVAETADEPTKSEFERAIANEALGRPLEDSLEAVSKRMESSDMDQVALIAGLNRRSGSNVAESLDRVAEGARERADMRREMKALTAQAKMSSTVLTALPGVLLLGLSVVSPRYSRPLLHTTIGIALLVVGTLMVFAGWKVMQKITSVDAV